MFEALHTQLYWLSQYADHIVATQLTHITPLIEPRDLGDTSESI